MAAEAPFGARDVFYGKLAERKIAADAAAALLRVVQTAPRAVDLELRRLERDALARLGELRTLVERAAPGPARALVRALFPEWLAATISKRSMGPAMHLRGEAAFGGILDLEAYGNVASPAGHCSC